MGADRIGRSALQRPSESDARSPQSVVVMRMKKPSGMARSMADKHERREDFILHFR